MRLLSLTITNLGVYGGEHRFALEPSDGPILLFGGKNGAGKTTLLESVRLCLHGPRSLGDRVSANEYEQHLATLMHRPRSAPNSNSTSSVRLSFEYAHADIKHHYEVVRSWQRLGDSIHEEFAVFEDRQALTRMSEERWKDFILDLIPPAISELFFFDGEKIQALAQDSTSDEVLAIAIKGLLGLDLVERLQADLGIYLRQQRKRVALPELAAAVEEAEVVYRDAESAYQQMRQSRAQTEAYLAHIQGRIEDKERDIARESKGFALARGELRVEAARLESGIDTVRREIRTLADGILPFALVPELCRQLSAQLEGEAEYQRWLATQEWVQSKIDSVRKTLHSSDFWEPLNGHLAEDDQVYITKALMGTLDQLSDMPEGMDRSIDLIHELAEPVRIQLVGWIDQAVDVVPAKLNEAIDQLEALTRRQQEVEAALHQVPDDDVLAPMIQELNNLNHELGKIQAKGESEDKELERKAQQRVEAFRELEKAYEALRGSESVERRLEMVFKAQNVLDEYLQQLTEEKTAALEQLVTDLFSQLSRKTDFVSRIDIDPVDFNVTLYSPTGIEIPKTELSAGEKQIYAIAMLWALRKLSGRPLPVIIDTPLGRLDSEHRQNLISRYFPHTSHQVILLSTDTEIDRNYFNELAPFVSRAYHLQYDTETGSSFAEEGYFWQEAVRANQ